MDLHELIDENEELHEKVRKLERKISAFERLKTAKSIHINGETVLKKGKRWNVGIRSYQNLETAIMEIL